MYKEDLTLNKLQWLMCHKTQPNQTEQKCKHKYTMNKIPKPIGIKYIWIG